MNDVTLIEAFDRPLLQPVEHRRPAAIPLLQIGAGWHPDRTYVRHIAEFRQAGMDVDLAVVADLASAREAVLGRMAKHTTLRPDYVWLEPFRSGVLDARAEIALNRAVRANGIRGVIVSTPPEEHRWGVSWALRSGLGVIVDKPVTSRAGAIYDLGEARAIAADTRCLIGEYEAVRRKAKVICIVNAQRRYHPAMQWVRRRIEEVRDRTGHPVSFIKLSHSDGLFRLPSEWPDDPYHGYTWGNGKLSHSAYHQLDILAYLLGAGWTAATRPTSVRVIASLVQPGALLTHVPRHRYEALFGTTEYAAAARYDEAEIDAVADRMGEVDAAITIELLRCRRPVGLATITLQHNTVSARFWLQPRANRYKQAGRMKRERWEIDSGMFQSITLETLQAEDQHDLPGVKGDAIGQPNHMQLTCTRNDQLLGLGPRLEVAQATELGGLDAEHLHSEQAKRAAFREFVEFLQGERTRADIRSELTDHRLSVELMSAAYVSHVLRQEGRSGWVTVRL